MKIKMILNPDCEKLYCIHYDKKGNLFLDKTRVAADATSDFDALLFKGKLHIVYKNRLNSIYYLTGEGKRMILKAKNIGKIRIQNVRLQIYRSHLLMFYSMFYQQKNMLCCQNLSRPSESPQVIDLCKTTEFCLQSSSEAFYVLYTAQSGGRITLRKFNGSWSEPNALCSGEFAHFLEMISFSDALAFQMETEQLPSDLLSNMHNNL